MCKARCVRNSFETRKSQFSFWTFVKTPRKGQPRQETFVLWPMMIDDPLQGNEVLIPINPGDLLLWDSRLGHAGRVRALAWASMCVCMGPRDRATREVISRRRNAIVEGWRFNNWPWEAAGTKVKVSSGRREKYPVPALTQEQIQLIWTK